MLLVIPHRQHRGGSEALQDATSRQDSFEADRAEAEECEDICTAAGRGKVGAVRHFLREDPTSVSKRERFGACRAHRGREPLHYAAYDGHVDVLEVLLGAKASVDAKSKDGATPLHYAAKARLGHDAFVERLLAAGAKVDAVDKDGGAPLHLAAMRGHATIVERLLAAGATDNATDNEGMTPYDLAERGGHAMVLGWLKPVTVHLGFGGNEVYRCNSHRYKTFNGLKDKVEKQFGVKIRAFVGPNGELLFLASDEDSWKLSPWESKIDIDNGDEITAIVDNPQQEQEPESGD